MRGRSTERASILLLGRNTVIFGAVLVTIVSFGLGYFFGYKGTNTSETEREIKEEVVRTDEVTPPEDKQEKKVLEASPANGVSSVPTVAPPNTQAASSPITPPAPVKQDTIKPPAPIPEIAPPKQPDSAAKAPGPPNPPKAEDASGIQGRDKIINKDRGGGDTKTSEKRVAAKAAGKKKPAIGAPRKKKAVVKAEGRKTLRSTYTVQVGAFPTKEGAEQLRKSLEAKGYKPYIIDAGEGDPYYRVRVGSFASRKDAEHGAGEITKQTGMKNFVTTK